MKLICFLLLLSTITLAYADEVVAPDRIKRPQTHLLSSGELEVEAMINSFTTTAHYDQKGKAISLQGQERYKKYDMEFGLLYGLLSQVNLGVRGRGRSIHSKTAEAREEGNLGMESLQGLLWIRLGKWGDWDFATHALYSRPLYRNDFQTASFYETHAVALGDGDEEWHWGLHMGGHVDLNLYLNLNVEYRRRHFVSNELFYSFLFHWYWMGVRSALTMGMEAIESLGTDPYSGRRPNLKVGPTYLFNSSNRSFFKPLLSYSLALSEQWRCELGYSYVVSGVSTDRGHEVWGKCGYLFFPNEERVVSSAVLPKHRIQAKVVNFSPRKKFLLINKGLKAGLDLQRKVDILEEDIAGEKRLLGHGRVVEIQSEQAVVEIMQELKGVKKEDEVFIETERL